VDACGALQAGERRTELAVVGAPLRLTELVDARRLLDVALVGHGVVHLRDARRPDERGGPQQRRGHNRCVLLLLGGCDQGEDE